MSTTKKKEGFSAEEKAAMRARAKELKAAADGESAVREALAGMTPADRALGERIHAIVGKAAPELVTTEKVGRVRRCTLAPYAFEGISTWLQRLDRFAQVVERTKGAR